MQPQARVVLCTVPNESVGETLARTLVEERLAACVNLVPGVRSIYRWQDKVEDDREWLLVIKTSSETYAGLEARISALHPYEVCEVLAFDVAAGSKAYLDWLLGQVSTRQASD